MPEGISDNPPPKKPGVVEEAARKIKESLPWDPIGKKKRSLKLGPEDEEVLERMADSVTNKSRLTKEKVLPQQREALQRLTSEHKINTLPDLATNIATSEKFIRELRNTALYEQDSYEPNLMKSKLGFRVRKPVENGWFISVDITRVAEERYRLPLAMYIDYDHAKLLAKGPYRTPEGMKIKVYNPMSSNFQEIKVNVDEHGLPVGTYANVLAGSSIRRGEYDITKFLEDPKLREYRDLLENIKAFNYQKDAKNCVPYCLFVNAMLYGLEPGNTEFKRNGIKQFERDFGVRILTREEITGEALPKSRVRMM